MTDNKPPMGLLLVIILLTLAIIGLAIPHGVRKSPAPGFCEKCKYDLAGIGNAGACPECGTLFDQAQGTPEAHRNPPRKPALIAAAAMLPMVPMGYVACGGAWRIFYTSFNHLSRQLANRWSWLGRDGSGPISHAVAGAMYPYLLIFLISAAMIRRGRSPLATTLCAWFLSLGALVGQLSYLRWKWTVEDPISWITGTYAFPAIITEPTCAWGLAGATATLGVLVAIRQFRVSRTPPPSA